MVIIYPPGILERKKSLKERINEFNYQAGRIFTDNVIQLLGTRVEKVIFVLWRAFATQKSEVAWRKKEPNNCSPPSIPTLRPS
jgi:hypothetical protein